MDTDALLRLPAVAELLRRLKDAPTEGLPFFDLPEANRSVSVLEACSGAGWIEFGRRNHIFHGPPATRRLHIESGWSFSVISGPNKKRMADFLLEIAARNQDPQEAEIRYHVRLTSDGRYRAAYLELAGAAIVADEKVAADQTDHNDISRSMARFLAVLTNGAADDRIQGAVDVLESRNLGVNEKLTGIAKMIPIPPTASARQLADMLGVSATAVKNSAWWKDNRRGQREDLIGKRHEYHRRRGEEERGSPFGMRRKPILRPSDDRDDRDDDDGE